MQSAVRQGGGKRGSSSPELTLPSRAIPPASHLLSLSFRPRAVQLWGWGCGELLPSRDPCPFPRSPPRSPGCPPGHAAAQRARPVHGAAAAGPADPGAEGNHSGPQAPSAPTRTPAAPFSFTHNSHLPMVHPWSGCGLSGRVPGAQNGSWPVAGAQGSGSDSVQGRKS